MKKIKEHGVTQGEILRNAARMVERGEITYSCLAVGCGGEKNDLKADYQHNKETIGFYEKLMTPRSRRNAEGEWLVPNDFLPKSLWNRGRERYYEARGHRVVALCFAAAVADAGGLQ